MSLSLSSLSQPLFISKVNSTVLLEETNKFSCCDLLRFQRQLEESIVIKGVERAVVVSTAKRPAVLCSNHRRPRVVVVIFVIFVIFVNGALPLGWGQHNNQ
jgi:hypothetical protein